MLSWRQEGAQETQIERENKEGENNKELAAKE